MLDAVFQIIKTCWTIPNTTGEVQTVCLKREFLEGLGLYTWENEGISTVELAEPLKLINPKHLRDTIVGKACDRGRKQPRLFFDAFNRKFIAYQKLAA